VSFLSLQFAAGARKLQELLSRKAVKLGDSEKNAVVMLKSYRSGAG